MSEYRRSLLESAAVLAVFVAAALWVLVVSLGLGWRSAPPTADGSATTAIRTVLGVPAWAFWGVLLPWGVCAAFTCVFALRGLADDKPDIPRGNGGGDGDRDGGKDGRP
jgi:hypothetical protein